MKTISSIVGIFVLLVSSISALAIEGIQVSVQSTNAVLSWPSVPGETYIVQYRSNLTASSWLTLTDYLSAASDTNVTWFVHSNSVSYPPLIPGNTNGGGSIDPTDTNSDNGSGGTNSFSSTTGFYRVVRDGAHIWGITNGIVLHDELITPIEFSVDSTDQIVGVTFYDTNNSPIIGASAQLIGGNAWEMVWNTTLSFNGDYAFYAEIDFASDSPVVSQPVTVMINNAISFPNYFSQVFGDQMWIYAQTIPNAGYKLDLYDENTNYLGSFNDYADANGTISFVWDLTDGNGNTYDSTNFFGVFMVTNSSSPNILSSPSVKSGSVADFQTASHEKKYFSTKIVNNDIHPNDVNSTSSAKQMWVKEGKWTPNDNWVLAYSPLTDPTADPNTSAKESLMMLGGSGEEYTGVLGALDAYGLNGNLSPGNMPQSTAFELADATSRANLVSYLANSRYENFYYFGHGNDSHISAYNGAASGISSDQIAFALGNVPLSYDAPPVLINVDPPIMVYPTVNPTVRRVALHPYRFVFLDGCETGSGLFCESFGIPAVTVSTNFFATTGVESRAFLGYTHEISFNTSQWDWRSLMLGGFLEDWESGNVNLQTCVGNAQAGAHSAGYQPMDSSAIIYGAEDMLLRTKTRP